jgi:hypothetical protein
VGCCSFCSSSPHSAWRVSPTGLAIIRVVDETGATLPGIGVTTGGRTLYSDAKGLSAFTGLSQGKHSFDADQPGVKSCGPTVLKVKGEAQVEGTLTVRVGSYGGGVIIGTDGREQSFEDIEFKACPGRPDSAVTTRIGGPGARS